MDDTPYFRDAKPETDATTFSDLRKASALVDDSVLRILAECGSYLGATHSQDNLEAHASGHGSLMSYALFEADMGGVKALAPLTNKQLHKLMEVTSQMNHPQGACFAQQIKEAAFDICPTQFEAVASQPAEQERAFA